MVVSDSEAYLIMHEMRLDYAIGKIDDSPEVLEKMREVLPDEDGKRWYDVLDTPQVDNLAVAFACGYLSDKEKASVHAKHPTVNWTEKYTHDAFISALDGLDEPYKKIIKLISKKDTDCEEWRALATIRSNDLPVGMYLKNCIDEARGA